ncbi:MAG: CoB--CoM heterodisulfide reductase iron-sulfur subunit B family protein [Methanocellales archaeon]
MEKLAYYPGCTVKTTALNFETSALAVAKALGVEMVEISRWNCCGAVASLVTDDLIHHIASIRNLIRVQELGMRKVVTLCSMCFNTLKQANLLVKKDSEKLKTISLFMDDEQPYRGEVEVYHFLELFRNIPEDKIKKRLTNLNIAPYYGCYLLRPKSVAIDDIEEPVIMQVILKTLGANAVDFPFKTECCGSYHTVFDRDIVLDRARSIIESARKRGAQALALSCPLCSFNLDERQRDIAKKYSDFNSMPVFYITQLMAIALGLEEEVCRFDLHYVDPRPLLKKVGVSI